MHLYNGFKPILWQIGRASKAEEKVSTANPRSTLGTLAEHILHTDRYILEHIWLYSLQSSLISKIGINKVLRYLRNQLIHLRPQILICLFQQSVMFEAITERILKCWPAKIHAFKALISASCCFQKFKSSNFRVVKRAK